MQLDVVLRLASILDRVVLSREAVEGVNTCVQDFVRDLLFTQKSFFSSSGVLMLKHAVAVVVSVVVSEGNTIPGLRLGMGATSKLCLTCNQAKRRFSSSVRLPKTPVGVSLGARVLGNHQRARFLAVVVFEFRTSWGRNIWNVLLLRSPLLVRHAL